MDDAHLVRQVASDMIRAHGADTLKFLLECEAADGIRGDALSADAWLDIATEAGKQLRRSE